MTFCLFKNVDFMDVDLLSKMIKELILDRDRVVLPGLGCFVAEMVPSTFSDKGYTINPPYRKLSFRSKPDMGDELIDFYVEANGLDRDVACRILGDFIGELRQVIFTKKVVVLPGLGRLRATKENNLFFIPDQDLDIYPAGVGLEPISLKTHVETPQEVAAALSGLKSIIEEVVTETESVSEFIDRRSFADAQDDSEDAQDDSKDAQDDSEDAQDDSKDVQDDSKDAQNDSEDAQDDKEVVLDGREDVLDKPVSDQVEELGEGMETPVEEVAESAEPEEVAEAAETGEVAESAETGEVVAEPVKKPKRSAGKRFLVAVGVVAALVVLFLTVYTLVAMLLPGIFDTILYTPEELEILNYKK